MEKLFKFVGILLVGTAIAAVLIPSNPTHERTPLSVTVRETVEKAKNFDIVKTAKYDSEPVSVDTIHKNLSTLERDIVTPKKTVTTKKLSHSELFKKLEKEVGKDAIELWCTVYCTDYDLSVKERALFNKTDDIIQNNFKSPDNQKAYDETFVFKGFIEKQGYRDEYYNFRLNNNHNLPQPTLAKTKSTTYPDLAVSLEFVDATPLPSKETTAQQQPKKLPKKDFTNTRYTEDFVKKYRLDRKNIKTDADKDFDKKYCRYLKLVANTMQQLEYGYDAKESYDEFMKIWREELTTSYLMFLSHECKMDYEEKMKQVGYKVVEWDKTRRL
jgi:hypothetical protein